MEFTDYAGPGWAGLESQPDAGASGGAAAAGDAG
jgi:hypothetical protein